MFVIGMVFEIVSNLFGCIKCGFNCDLVLGGSLGGEGVFVGLYGSLIGIGIDVVGSIRVLCGFNLIFGIRFLIWRLSYDGVVISCFGVRGIVLVIGLMCYLVCDMEFICKIVMDVKLWD